MPRDVSWEEVVRALEECGYVLVKPRPVDFATLVWMGEDRDDVVVIPLLPVIDPELLTRILRIAKVSEQDFWDCIESK